MAFKSYLKDLKRIQKDFIQYIECNDHNDDFYYSNLIKVLDQQIFLDERYALQEFLIYINKVSKNYHRYPSFFDKIEKILLYYKKKIKNIFLNLEIFQFFKTNKRILLFLIQQQIIIINDEILYLIELKGDMHYENLYSFLYNEIKDQIPIEKKESIEKQLLKLDPNIFNNFQEKCLIGENDSQICNIIRQDLIDEFVTFTNQNTISLSSKIEKSIFETNSFLINQEPTLIEYAAFFGSIQIFQYLRLNNVELTPSLWLYSIHSMLNRIYQMSP